MDADYNRQALLCALRSEYGILTLEALDEAIGAMEKVDISQFIAPILSKSEIYSP